MTRNQARDALGLNPIKGGDDATVEGPGQGFTQPRWKTAIRAVRNRNFAPRSIIPESMRVAASRRRDEFLSLT
jgi:hypothetical protein